MTSFWLDCARRDYSSEFVASGEFDVVVGVGLTGVVTALLFARAGRRASLLKQGRRQRSPLAIRPAKSVYFRVRGSRASRKSTPPRRCEHTSRRTVRVNSGFCVIAPTILLRSNTKPLSRMPTV